MATRVITIQARSGRMFDDIFKKKPTFKDIYPMIGADIIEIVKGTIEIDTNQGIKTKTVEMWTDEEAKIKGKSVNDKATMAYRTYWARKKQWTNDTINGTVAVIIPNYEQFEVEAL